MSFQSATAAQRLAVRDTTSKSATITQKFAQRAEAPTTLEAAEITPILLAVANALSAVGVSASLPATQAVVSNGGSVAVKNSAGVSQDTATYTVAANAVDSVKLPATSAVAKNAVAVYVRNSLGALQTTAPLQVATGVLDGVKLAATATVVKAADVVTVPITFVTARAAGAQATVAATITVAGGVISAISIA